ADHHAHAGTDPAQRPDLRRKRPRPRWPAAQREAGGAPAHSLPALPGPAADGGRALHPGRVDPEAAEARRQRRGSLGRCGPRAAQPRGIHDAGVIGMPPSQQISWNRRRFLTRATGGFGLAALAALLKDDGLLADEVSNSGLTPPARQAKATSGIFIFLIGGM